MFSSIVAWSTKCQISINSSLASSSLKAVGFFHHFQFVNLCSSTASCVIAVQRKEILSSVLVGYLGDAKRAARFLCILINFSSLSTCQSSKFVYIDFNPSLKMEWSRASYRILDMEVLH